MKIKTFLKAVTRSVTNMGEPMTMVILDKDVKLEFYIIDNGVHPVTGEYMDYSATCITVTDICSGKILALVHEMIDDDLDYWDDWCDQELAIFGMNL